MTERLQLELLGTEAYRQALIKSIKGATERVSLGAMVILWGKKTKPIFDELKKATQRGVKVRIVVDKYTRLAFLYGVDSADRKERVKKTFDSFKELSKLGAKVHYFGTLGIPPQKGRCHVKISVIDNEAYCFGGVNIFDEAADYDYMLHTKDAAWADCLDQLIQQIARRKPPLKNGEVSLDTTSSILFDGGKPKVSIIYDKACELARNAKKIYYVSQFTPSGLLGTLLSKKDAICYTNRPLQMNAPNRWAQAFDLRRYNIKNTYKHEAFLHAKFILFEMADGTKALLSGSHNFSYRGVVYGTQEIALYSTSPKLWNRLYKFLEEHIA